MNAADANPGTGAPKNDASAPGPTQLVWLEAEASNFDPLACGLSNPGGNSDLKKFAFYLFGAGTQSGATVRSWNSNPGLWKCAAPTEMHNWSYAKGTAAVLDALLASPPAPFQGTYVTIPIAVNAVDNLEFHYWVHDNVTKARVDDVFVVSSFDIDAQVTRNLQICNPGSYAASIAASPKAPSIRAFIPDQTGFDVAAHLDDGTLRLVKDAEARVCLGTTGPNQGTP